MDGKYWMFMQFNVAAQYKQIPSVSGTLQNPMYIKQDTWSRDEVINEIVTKVNSDPIKVKLEW
jgi:hypothetical protein